MFASPATAQAPRLELRQLPPKEMALVMVKNSYASNYKKQYACLDNLLTHESGWRTKALNHSSGAFGLFQFMPHTWKNYNFPYKPKDAYTQLRAGLRYVHKRYGSPCAAWNFWKKQAGADLRGGWY